MFQKKLDGLLSGMPNVFTIADDILTAGFDELGRDHDVTLDKVLRICRQANLKLHKNTCHFTCNSIPFFGEIISWQAVCPGPRKAQALVDMPPPKSMTQLQLFWGILNYLRKLSSVTAEVCEPLKKLTSVKAD